MPRRARIRRRVGLALALLGLAVGGAIWFLRSAYAAEQVASRLTAAAGAPVQFSSLDLGFTGSTVHGLEVLERNAAPGSRPWLTIGTVDVGLSLWQLLRGDLAGGLVSLRDVRVVLRFDRAGRLLTRLPEPPAAEEHAAVPTIRVADGSLTISREGQPDAVFRNVALELRQDGPALLLDGGLDDPEWGPWTILGSRMTPTAPLAFNFKTRKDVRVTPELLRRTPFVSPTVWDHVTCEGVTPCELALQFNPVSPLNYRVALEPRDTKVYVRAIDLRTRETSGKVTIADDVLTLENVRGHAAGGELKLRSLMDFRGIDTIMRFSVEAGLLSLNDLPASWGVPPLRGELNGRAELELTVRAGRTIIRGQGEGVVRVFPLLRALKVQLISDGQRLRFHIARD